MNKPPPNWTHAAAATSRFSHFNAASQKVVLRHSNSSVSDRNKSREDSITVRRRPNTNRIVPIQDKHEWTQAVWLYPIDLILLLVSILLIGTRIIISINLWHFTFPYHFSTRTAISCTWISYVTRYITILLSYPFSSAQRTFVLEFLKRRDILRPCMSLFSRQRSKDFTLLLLAFFSTLSLRFCS